MSHCDVTVAFGSLPEFAMIMADEQYSTIYHHGITDNHFTSRRSIVQSSSSTVGPVISHCAFHGSKIWLPRDT